MAPTPIYLVSGSSNSHRSYVLSDPSNVQQYTEQPWGHPVAHSWVPPELALLEQTPALPEADFTSFYLPGLLIASKSAATSVAYQDLELLPVRAETGERVLLNPQLTLTRFREEGSNVIRVPSGAIILMQSADFYAEDVPPEPRLFWFHDGNFPRFLLCNEQFRSRIRSAKLGGLTFTPLGHARTDG